MADGESPDQEQKTEEPTHKRLEEAREKGNVPFSRELGSFLLLLIFVFTVAWYAPTMLRNSKNMLLPFISHPETMATDMLGVSIIMRDMTFGIISILAIPLLGAAIAAIASGILQNGLMISGESIKPKLEKISIIAGFKRLFSMKSIVEFIKGIFKISIVGIVAYMAVRPEMAAIENLGDRTNEAMLLFMFKLVIKMLSGIVIAMFFIALFDLVYQRLHYIKSLRMTKQEIKDEYKQSEGDPMIKQKLRQLRQEKAKQRMMSAVPKSDVVITNPTHFAVALQYNTKLMSAPKVVAKGQDLVALKIREIAEENGIPVVQNPPLARALFKSTDLEEEIPTQHYEAVAKIISYVYQLKGKKTG